MITGPRVLCEGGFETVANAIRQMQTHVGMIFLSASTRIADYRMGCRPGTGDLNDWTRIGECAGRLLTLAGLANGNDPGKDHSLILQAPFLSGI